MKRCRRCDGSMKDKRGDLCSACSEYRRTRGTDRPDRLITRHGQRLMERNA